MSASGKKKAKPRKAPVKSKAKVTKPKKSEKKAAPQAEKPKVVKKAKAAEKTEASVKPAAKAPPAKLGTPPMAVVASRHIDSMHERAARGFSFGELSSAGISLTAAKREEVSVDVRRRSVVEQNVRALKSWYKTPGGGPAGGAEMQVAVQAVAKKK